MTEILNLHGTPVPPETDEAAPDPEPQGPQPLCAVGLFLMPGGGVRYQGYPASEGVEREAEDADTAYMCGEVLAFLHAKKAAVMTVNLLNQQAANIAAAQHHGNGKKRGRLHLPDWLKR